MGGFSTVAGGKHASTHVSGGADAITSKLDYRAMNIVCARGTKTITFSTTSTSYVDAGLSISITLPVASNVLVFAQVFGLFNTSAGYHCYERIVRDTTGIREIYLSYAGVEKFNSVIQTLDVNIAAGTYTYKLQVKVDGGTGYWEMSVSPQHGEIVAVAFPY
ncbi:MAG: hypothetical protein QXJ07_06420 [Candidatus Bathyarchaeia archaeon]